MAVGNYSQKETVFSVERIAEISKPHERAAPATSHGRDTAPDAAPLSPVMQLQQQAGNQTVQQLLRSGYIQAKLAISNPDDPEEREADQVAHKVMRAHAVFSASTPCACSHDGDLCEECQQKQSQATIHRRASAPTAPANVPRIVSDVLRSPGHPLDSATRAFFEPRFGYDFSHVRLHTDSSAAESARSISARAYTAGEHIVFDLANYSPHTAGGRELLAHELTHTLQQPQGPMAGNLDSLRMSTPGESSEREARTVSRQVVASSQVQSIGVSAVPHLIQGDWLDDAKAAVSDTYESAKSTASGAYNAVASTVSDAATAVSSAASDAVQAVSSTASQVYNAAVDTGKAAVSAVTSTVSAAGEAIDKTKRELTINMLKGRLSAVMQQLDAAGGEVKPSEARRLQLNNNIGKLNAAVGTDAIPLVDSGRDIGEIAIKVGEVITGLEFLEAAPFLIIVAFLLLILLALALIVAENVDDYENEKKKEEEEKKKKEGERDEDEDDKEKEEDKEKEKEDEEDECPALLAWSPTTTVQKVVASGGIVGALELCKGKAPHGFFYVGHHVWPKFVGGPEEQPLMGIFGFVHISIIHPLLNGLLTTTFNITNHTTDPKNIAFIARLRTDPALRAQVAAVLTGFYVSLNVQTVPPIDPRAYTPGIVTSLASLT